MKAIAGGSENERVSLATVKLDIIDINDNSPQFSQEVTSLNVFIQLKIPTHMRLFSHRNIA